MTENGRRREVEEVAEVLDEVYPGWAERVNLQQFHISDPGNCVLYYADGRYGRGMKKMRFSRAQFSAGTFSSPLYQGVWREVIQARKDPITAEFNRLCQEEEAKAAKRAKMMVLSMLIVSTLMTLFT